MKRKAQTCPQKAGGKPKNGKSNKREPIKPDENKKDYKYERKLENLEKKNWTKQDKQRKAQRSKHKHEDGEKEESKKKKLSNR